MGVFGIFKNLLTVRRSVIHENDWENKQHNEKLLSKETTDTSSSHTAEHKSEKYIPRQTATFGEGSESKVTGRKAPNKTVQASRLGNTDSVIALPVGEFVHHERPNIEHNGGILKNTFIHIKGIGHQKESALWADGILTHDDALNTNALATKKNCLRNSKHDLENKSWQPFYEGMSSRDHWRLFGDLVTETAYIDIETTGLGSSTDIITTAVVHSLQNTHVFVNGINLDKLAIHLSKFSLIVTYNGKSFDIPFIERFFQTKITTPHVDLRYVLAGMGYKGGLKSCEQQLRLPNRKGMEEIDGYTAVLLWDYYCKTKDPMSLETLLAYNYEDSVRLEWLMIEAYNQKVSGLPFDSDQIYRPDLPSNPYTSHSAVLRKI